MCSQHWFTLCERKRASGELNVRKFRGSVLDTGEGDASFIDPATAVRTAESCWGGQATKMRQAQTIAPEVMASIET